MRSTVGIVVLLICLVSASYYIMLLRADINRLKQKVADERQNLSAVKATMERDERELDLHSLQEKRRIENLNQLIESKKKDLDIVEQRIGSLKQNPDSAKAKKDAEADLNMERQRVEILQKQIQTIEQAKNNRKAESHDDQQAIESRFRTQEIDMNYKVKTAEDQLHGLEAELRAIKVPKNDQIAQAEKNSKSQEVVNQRAYVSDLRVQKRELEAQHEIQKNDVGSGLNADQRQADSQLGELRAKLKDEKSRLDALDKNLKSFSNSEQGVRNQLALLQEQKQDLVREISELEKTH